ncbi:MAG: glycosyltransferase, partial [Anaerolineae bacterium]|nr:glycosyltransferase [Anaerolineae bacterium]
VNWNTRELLTQCLASIEMYPPEAAYEVLVVDNASTDGSAAMVRSRFPQVRLIENPENVGFAVANNQAIRLSEGQYALLLNSDTEVYPGALEAMIQFMEG